MESRKSAGPVCEMGLFGGETACFGGNAAVRNHCRRQLGGDDADGGCGARGRQENGYRTVLEIIARSTQPCIGVYVAGDSLAPGVVGGVCNLGVVFTYWNGSEYLQNCQLQLLINLAGVFSVSVYILGFYLLE